MPKITLAELEAMMTPPVERSGVVSVRLLFEPRDLWIGVYWKTFWEGPRHQLALYVCVIPMLPLQVTITRRSLV